MCLFEQEEGEALTMMEIQKARDLLQQHEGNAAKLLQKAKQYSQALDATQPDDIASDGAPLQVLDVPLDSCNGCDGVSSLPGSIEGGDKTRGVMALGPPHDEDDDFGFDSDGMEFLLDDVETDDDGLESEETGDDVEGEEEEDDDEIVVFSKEEEDEEK